MKISRIIQEQNVNTAFSNQSPIFDDIYDSNQLTSWARKKVHEEVLQFIKKGQLMLELNCGTGTDAIFFANYGVNILATDNADGMIEATSRKINNLNLNERITVKQCSFANLDSLGIEEKFDYIYSNFGGLNCIQDLSPVLTGIEKLLKPGGRFTLVIMPKFCLWELLLIFKGNFKTALRRFKINGTSAKIEGQFFQCYYHSPNAIKKNLKNSFKLIGFKGLAIVVPPPFIENFVERHPNTFKILNWIEAKIDTKYPFCNFGDYYIISMQKNEN